MPGPRAVWEQRKADDGPDQRQSSSVANGEKSAGSAPSRSHPHSPFNKSTQRPDVALNTGHEWRQAPQRDSLQSYELPSLSSVNGGPHGHLPPPPSRLAGVSSILQAQPTSTVEYKNGGGRKRQSPEPEHPTLPPIFTETTQRRADRTAAASPISAHDSLPRRILTPRSPSLQHSRSTTQMPPSNALFSAQEHPFAISPNTRSYSLHPGSAGIPNLPASPAVVSSGPTYSFGPSSSLEGPTGVKTGVTPRPVLSANSSPQTPLSTFESSEQRRSPSIQSSSTAPYSGMDGAHTNVSESQVQPPIPISSSGGQNVYQIMTVNTATGSVQLPVDVQAASRQADEKRRRNAGASARFRQRRKEKEREASTTIARLEQQLKELNEGSRGLREEVEHYRRERDYFKSSLHHFPGGDRYFQDRPVSPRRSSGPTVTRTANVQYSPQQEDLHGSNGEHDRKRHASAYSALGSQVSPAMDYIQRDSDSHWPSRATTGAHGVTTIRLAPSEHVENNARQGNSSAQHAYAHLSPHPTQQSHNGSPPLVPRNHLPTPSNTASSPAVQRHPQQVQPLDQPPRVLHVLPRTGPYNPYASDRRPSGPQDQPRRPQ